MVVRLIFSSILEIWYVEVRIYRSISESPLDLEITRVDCTFYNNKMKPATMWLYTIILQDDVRHQESEWRRESFTDVMINP